MSEILCRTRHIIYPYQCFLSIYSFLMEKFNYLGECMNTDISVFHVYICLTGPRSFLLFGQKNSLSRLLPDTDDCPDVVLPIHSVKNIKDIEFDPVSQYIYWVRVNLYICIVHFMCKVLPSGRL
jgi:hypothetical protein